MKPGVNFPASGLKARSIIRLTRLVTVEERVVNARLGEISPERLRRIKMRLAGWIMKD